VMWSYTVQESGGGLPRLDGHDGQQRLEGYRFSPFR
jgi:hypothetical protein